MNKAASEMSVSRGELLAMAAVAVLAGSIPLWLPLLLDTYTLAFLDEALMRVMCL